MSVDQGQVRPGSTILSFWLGMYANAFCRKVSVLRRTHLSPNEIKSFEDRIMVTTQLAVVFMKHSWTAYYFFQNLKGEGKRWHMKYITRKTFIQSASAYIYIRFPFHLNSEVELFGVQNSFSLTEPWLSLWITCCDTLNWSAWGNIT